jgi:hypothetical protein
MACFANHGINSRTQEHTNSYAITYVVASESECSVSYALIKCAE